MPNERSLFAEHPQVEEQSQDIAGFLARSLAIERDELDPTQPISFYGLDSLDAILLSRRLKDHFNLNVPQLRLLSDITVEQIEAMAPQEHEAFKGRIEELRPSLMPPTKEALQVTPRHGLLTRVREGTGPPIM